MPDEPPGDKSKEVIPVDAQGQIGDIGRTALDGLLSDSITVATSGVDPDPQIAAIVADAQSRVGPLVSRVVTTTAGSLTAEQSRAGESALGIYSVTINSLMASGGDGFWIFNDGFRREFGVADIEALGVRRAASAAD